MCSALGGKHLAATPEGGVQRHDARCSRVPRRPWTELPPSLEQQPATFVSKAPEGDWRRSNLRRDATIADVCQLLSYS